MPVIRKPEIADALRLARLEERTFRETFAGTNTQEDMALHRDAYYGEAIQLREISDPGLEILVCENEGELIGFVQLRWGQPPDCVNAERPTEIQRLYVSTAWHGQGVAQDLMAASIGIAEERGADQVWLGVWEHNPRAIAFYKKRGFAEVGAHIFPLGTDPQRDIVMTRAVGRGELG